MIVYLVTKEHQYTIREYLEFWAPDLMPEFYILAYENILDLASRYNSFSLPAGTYICTDIERLTAEGKSFASLVVAAAVENGNIVLNHPDRVLCRFELLKTLYELGINSFAVYAIGEKPLRFPVFLRKRADHSGPRTRLIHSQAQLDKAVDELRAKGFTDDSLMITEYCHCADANGIFRKFGCQLIGDVFVPDHLFFDTEWTIKNYKKPPHQELLFEEDSFIRNPHNPHEEQVRKIFAIANIEYGRIDYGLVDGKIQVWEINTNPQIDGPVYAVPPNRLSLRTHIHTDFTAALVSLLQPSQAHPHP